MSDPQPPHVDVLIIGAGISGLGAAHYLRTRSPTRSYAILEARAELGGTWDLFRYPGARSDSDLYTFGYEFRPWQEPASIADAGRILAYLRATAVEDGTDRLIRYRHRVVSAAWSTADARWTVLIDREGQPDTLTCSWIFAGTGYYRYDEGYTPDFVDREKFQGPIVHPQHWPTDLDVTGRRVVVIGSGATAVSLAPALARTAAHVTVLQRTPTYVVAVPARDPIAIGLQKMLGKDRAHPLIRQRSILSQAAIWQFCRRFPGLARTLIRRAAVRRLPPGYPVDVHFNPPYHPWDQRLCAVPDGDLFTAISAGQVSMVTDQITGFTKDGLALASGSELPADLIVTATGLNLLPFGGITLSVDGSPVDLSAKVSYKGMMLSDVPNLAYAIGYTNASWTLKVGLLCEYFCRLLQHMSDHGHDLCYPQLTDPGMPTRPMLDFGAGYVRRSLAALPRQGSTPPWATSVSYRADVKQLRTAPVADEYLRFARIGRRSARHEALEVHTRAQRQLEAARTERARPLVADFVRQAGEQGLRPVPLRARGYSGAATYRTPLLGWYLQPTGLLAIGTDGGFYLLITAGGLAARLRGVQIAPSPPTLEIGRGARDGESMSLQELLQRRLAAGNDFRRRAVS